MFVALRVGRQACSAASRVMLLRQTTRQLSLTPAKAGGGWTYRAFAPASQKHENMGVAITAFAVWWIFYGIFTEPEHIFGHEPYPNLDDYTDEQLGIPPIEDE